MNYSSNGNYIAIVPFFVVKRIIGCKFSVKDVCNPAWVVRKDHLYNIHLKSNHKYEYVKFNEYVYVFEGDVPEMYKLM